MQLLYGLRIYNHGYIYIYTYSPLIICLGIGMYNHIANTAMASRLGPIQLLWLYGNIPSWRLYRISIWAYGIIL